MLSRAPHRPQRSARRALVVVVHAALALTGVLRRPRPPPSVPTSGPSLRGATRSRAWATTSRAAVRDAALIPSNPVRQFAPVDPCRTELGAFTVRYSVSVSADLTITDVTAQTQPSVDLPT